MAEYSKAGSFGPAAVSGAPYGQQIRVVDSTGADAVLWSDVNKNRQTDPFVQVGDTGLVEQFFADPGTYTLRWSGGSASVTITTGVADLPKFGGPPQVSPAATMGVKAALARKIRSTTIQLIGDSTGDSLDQVTGLPNNEWFTVLGAAIGAANPYWSVWHRRWNTATEVYDLPTVIQAGTGNGGGDRYALFNGGTLQFTSTFGPTADHYVTAKILPNSWAPGGASAQRTIVCRYSSTSGSNRGWYMALDETGHLVWVWSATGAADVATVTSTAVVPFANGTPGWVKVEFDVDNGASGNDVKFYTSPDGSTWTQLGTTVTTAGVTSISSTFLNYYLGSHSTTPVSKFDGRIYWVDVRSSSPTGNSQVPLLPDWWDQATSPGAGVQWGGAPVLLLLNGSATGQNIVYFNDSTRRAKLASPHAPALLFLNDGHNEATYSQGIWRTNLAAWLTDVRSRYNCPVVVTTQNPSIKGTARADQETADWTTARGPSTLSLAATYAGMFPLDVWPQFNDLTNQLAADGLHPSPAGSLQWGGYVYSQLFQ